MSPLAARLRPDRWTVLCGALLAGGALLLWSAGPAPLGQYPSDVVNYLDASQRTLLGQWMARDYTAPIGPAALWPVALAMRLTGQAHVNALGFGSIVLWLAFGLCAWQASRPRLRPWLAVGFTLLVAGTAAAPYVLDFGRWDVPSYAMGYNRQAWALLCLASLLALLPRHDGRAPRSVPFAFGFISIWLWADKPNYLLVLLPLFLHAWLDQVARCGRTGCLRGGLAGAVTALTLIWCLVPFSVSGYLRTHAGMAASADGADLVPGLLRALRENLWAVALLGYALAWHLRSTPGPAVSPWRRLLPYAAVAVTVFAANTTNCQYSEIPLWAALGCVLWESLLSRPTAQWPFRFALVAAALPVVLLSWQPLLSLPYAWYWKKSVWPRATRTETIHSPAWQGLPLRPLLWSDNDQPSPETLVDPAVYARWLNDGLSLLTPHLRPTDRILCLDWSNPFPFATQTEPPHGEEIAWSVSRTVGPAHHPDPEQLLQSATLIMEPRTVIVPRWQAFKRELLGSSLSEHFVCAAESAQWRLWVRRTDSRAH